MTMAETPTETTGALTDPMDRRSALKKAAAAGAIVWTAPMILSSTAVGLIAAMTYDKTVNAIGPFEVTEYLGLAMVWGALAVTAPGFVYAGVSCGRAGRGRQGSGSRWARRWPDRWACCRRRSL